MSQEQQEAHLDLKERFASAKPVKAKDLNEEITKAKPGDMVTCEYGDTFCAVPDKKHCDKLYWIKYNGEDWSQLLVYAEWMGSVNETYKDNRRAGVELDELRVAFISLMHVSKLINELGGTFEGPSGTTDYFHATLPMIVHVIAMHWMKADGKEVSESNQEDVEKYNTLVYMYIEEFASLLGQYANAQELKVQQENLNNNPPTGEPK